MPTVRIRERLRRSSTIVVLAAAAACGPDKPMVPLAQVAGSWTLTSVSGVSLPATIQAANPRLEIISETLVIRTDGTFEQTRLLRSTNGGQASDTLARDKGTYDLYVAAAMLHFQGNGTTASAEIDGSNLIVSSPGNALTYRKQ